MDFPYLESDSIAVHSYDDAVALMKILLENGYAVMLTTEESLYMVNWVWTETFSDRNEVIFTNRALYECEWDKWLRRHPEIDFSIDKEED